MQLLPKQPLQICFIVAHSEACDI